MDTKFIHIEDDTGILFAANGTPLLAVMAGFTDILPIAKFHLPILSVWLYFFGLIFIFFSKIIIQTFNDDMRQRERLQNGRNILLENLSRDDIPEELRNKFEENWNALDKYTETLVQEKMTAALARWRAIFFLLSGFCFLISSFILILSASAALAN